MNKETAQLTGSTIVYNREFPNVLVMMATYNGEKYVAEQIDSILGQEGVHVTLLISDDGSTDSTCDICEEYASANPNVIFGKNGYNKDLARNFMDMVYEADPERYDYFAFSDQDDFWLPEKLRKAIEVCIEGLEQEGLSETEPVLYYSDVMNVDVDLQGGNREYASFRTCQNNIGTLLMNNWASGCTMVFNSSMCDLLQEHKLAEFPRIHDSWVHLVALSCATVVPDLDNSYILRRLSGDNQVGERDFGDASLGRFSAIIQGLKLPSKHEMSSAADRLLDLYGKDMHICSREVIEKFVGARDHISRRLLLSMQGKFRMPTAVDTLIVKMRILTGRY